MAAPVPVPPLSNSQEFADYVFNNKKPAWFGWSDSTKEQYFNMLNAEQANEHELEMWRLNNEYNTPANQMQRMLDAGINPAAAYGQVSSGNSSSAPGTHKTDSTKWHDFSDRIQLGQFAVNTVNDFIKTVGDVINNLVGMPEQFNRNRSSSYQAELLSRELSGYDNFRNDLLHTSMPEWQRVVDSGLHKNYTDLGDGWFVQNYRLHDPASLKYIRDFIDVSQRQETRDWYKSYRQHMESMFENEEDMIQYEKEMKKWLNDYKRTLPPEARYAIDLVEHLFTTFGSPYLQYKAKTKNK